MVPRKETSWGTPSSFVTLMFYSRVTLWGVGSFYADDTVLYCVDSTPAILEAKMNGNLAKLEAWCSLNKLTINSKKNKYVLFHNPSSNHGKIVLKLEICGVPFNRVKSNDYLGVRWMKPQLIVHTSKNSPRMQ